MALFFDQAWFDVRLSSVGLERAHAASALGLTAEQIAEVWKDQRELRGPDVAILAALLSVPPQEVAHRAGVSTPVPAAEPTLRDLAARIARLEAEIAALKAKMG